MGGQRGLTLPSNPDMIVESHSSRVFEEVKRAGVDFVLCVTKDKTDSIHDELKLFEAKTGTITQHLWQQTVRNVVQKNQNVTLENILLKTNEKLSGTNMTIGTSREFGNKNRTAHPRAADIV